ncbi:MAG: hypothetical protein QM780_03230 [Hyphomicrobium sp.]|uniref:hypothetical protein n=1 Tax=Hyphomicrobium sp. TaxID=82 RepID=UPI0039E36E0C
MSANKFAGHTSLFADVSFADLWRAARYRRHGGHQELPSVLDAAYASRFAAPSQPFGTEAEGSRTTPAIDVWQYRQAA